MVLTAKTEPQEPRHTSALSLKAVWPENTIYALGLAVRVLANLPAFSRLSFGEWAATLAGQIERGHYLFVLRNNDVEGIAGWAFADHDQATSWLEGHSGLPHEACYDGDCVILNVWQTRSRPAQRFLLNHLRGLFADKKMLVAKRFYADGRVRPVRIVNNDFMANHLPTKRPAESQIMPSE